MSATQRSGAQQLRRQRQPRVRRHPGRGGVHEPVGRADARRRTSAGVPAGGAARAEPVGEGGRESRARSASTSRIVSRAVPRVSRAWATAAPAPPAPSRTTSPSAASGEAPVERPREARTSRCCARSPGRRGRRRCSPRRAPRRRGRARRGARRTSCLQGWVTLTPVVAGQRGRAASRSPTRLGRQAEGVEVEPAVQVAQTELVGLALVHRRGERRADARCRSDRRGSCAICGSRAASELCTSW